MIRERQAGKNRYRETIPASNEFCSVVSECEQEKPRVKLSNLFVAVEKGPQARYINDSRFSNSCHSCIRRMWYIRPEARGPRISYVIRKYS
jgi:hypothetical protein